jgi:molecular chaperone DnaK (HSP70)
VEEPIVDSGVIPPDEVAVCGAAIWAYRLMNQHADVETQLVDTELQKCASGESEDAEVNVVEYSDANRSPPDGRYASSPSSCPRNSHDCLREAMISLSLGVQTAGGVMTRILHRNTWIPNKKSAHFSTVKDGQSSVRIEIFEGERLLTADNHHLHTLELIGIPPMKRGRPQIEITFWIDPMEELTVIATEKISGVQAKVVIPTVSRIQDDEEVQRLVNAADGFMGEDLDRLNGVFLRLLRNADSEGESTDIERTMQM